jgi:O-antigen/teichoic acid export membrane protein
MADIDLSYNSHRIIINPDRISRNSFWILLGLVSSTLISFVTIFFLTRYLGPERFGIYSLALSVAGLFLPMADLGLDLHMTRAISSIPSTIRDEISKTLSAKLFLITAFMLLTISTAFILGYSANVIIYISLFAISYLLGSVAQTFVGALRAIQKMKFESLAMFIGRAVGMTGVIVLILIKGALLTIILAHLVGSLVNLLSSLFFLKTQIMAFNFRIDYEALGGRLKGALPFGLTAVFVAVYFKIDTVILSKLTNEAVVGLYNGAQNFVLASMMLSTPLVVALFPVLASTYDRSKSEANNIFRQGLKYSLLLGLLLGTGFLLMAEPIVDLAYGREFSGSISILEIMAISIPLIFATGIVGNSMGAVGFQLRVCIVTLICMIFNIVVNLILIPRYGGGGAAVAKVSTEFLRLVQLWYLMRGIFAPKAAFDLLKICACCVVAYLGFEISHELIGKWPAAVAFALIYTIGAFMLRLVVMDELKSMIKSSRENE